MMLLLGDADKKAPETFDATAALNNLGWIAETELTDTQSQLAALREENAQLRSGMKGDYDLDAWLEWVVTAKALREELATQSDLTHSAVLECQRVEQRLADAERRNAVMTECLERLRGCSQLRPTPSLVELIDAALNPKPEAASHDE